MESSSNEMQELHLDFYGVKVAVSAANAVHRPLISRLREDFEYFQVPALTGPLDITFHFDTTPVADTLKRPLFSTRMCRVHGLGLYRTCDYGNGLKIVSENAPQMRSMRLLDPNLAKNGEEAYEVAYTTLLSAIGEALDLRGFHRAHALAFERNGKGWLILLPSGSGKSCLCTQLLKDPSARIYSDEMPLIRGNIIYPFPVRIALKPKDTAILMPGVPGRRFERRLFPAKILFPIPKERVAVPAPVSLVLTDISRPTGILKSFSALFSTLVVGIGLTQMSEHMLRLDSLHRLTWIAFSRLKTAVNILYARKGSVMDQDIEWLQSKKLMLIAQFRNNLEANESTEESFEGQNA